MDMVEILAIICYVLIAIALLILIGFMICFMIKLEKESKALDEAMLNAYDELWREINKEDEEDAVKQDEIPKD